MMMTMTKIIIMTMMMMMMIFCVDAWCALTVIKTYGSNLERLLRFFGARAMHREELEMAALNGFSFCAYIVPTNSIEYKRMMHLLSLIELRTTMYPVGFLRVPKWGCEENSNQNYMVF